MVFTRRLAAAISTDAMDKLDDKKGHCDSNSIVANIPPFEDRVSTRHTVPAPPGNPRPAFHQQLATLSRLLGANRLTKRQLDPNANTWISRCLIVKCPTTCAVFPVLSPSFSFPDPGSSEPTITAAIQNRTIHRASRNGMICPKTEMGSDSELRSSVDIYQAYPCIIVGWKPGF